MPGDHLCAHFYDKEHKGFNDGRVKINDETDKNQPTVRESFSDLKLNYFVPPQGLNLRNFS